ncbi:Os11g0209025 [Oryza sativa Japonica Group]|uniref:Os11g0209025 protein n=1 Tax=Oryza sativa subsp. japonica TaxID=39947 RepID=A0A0P0Y006_ORYSJ|nr:Os11g0209025 [Oryza sativa Japonica Group]
MLAPLPPPPVGVAYAPPLSPRVPGSLRSSLAIPRRSWSWPQAFVVVEAPPATAASYIHIYALCPARCLVPSSMSSEDLHGWIRPQLLHS